MIRFCFVSSCRISHFGINPDNGGRPPSDSRVIRAMIDRSGDFDDDDAIELIFVELNVLNSKNVVRVIIIYRIRFSCVKLGL